MKPEPKPRSRFARFCGALFFVKLWLALLLWAAWTFGALSWDLPEGWPQAVGAWGFVGLFVFLVGFFRGWRRLVLIAVPCAVVTTWWFTIEPSNARDWEADQAVAAHADIDGDRVTIHGVRDCRYRSETDYDVAYHDRTVDLSKLTRVDMFLCYWGSPWLAHPIVSFQFEDADPICVSIETRREKGEGYTTVGGLYRQYELIYIVAEERDVIPLRAKYRAGEEAYLFRLDVPVDHVRRIFLDYLTTLNEMHERPRWYHVLTSNCTTNIRAHSAATAQDPRPWSWQILLPGKLDEVRYGRSQYRGGMDLQAFKEKSRVEPIGSVSRYSETIRKGVPGFGD